MVILEHEHSLTLIDLNPDYPHDEEVYDDEEDLIINQAFQIPCECCGREITYLHRYYYKCDKCDYNLHKVCANPPTKLEHASHSAHTLTLFLDESQSHCHICKSIPLYKQLSYQCFQCMFNICLDCGVDGVQEQTIYHPSHRHPIISIQIEILAFCNACGKEHKGVFYHCPICLCYFIHHDCAFRPKRFLVQDGTRGRFFHTHLLILAYSFPKVDQEAKFYPPCRVCGDSFANSENLWIYKCDKCRYYVHLDCANLRRSPSNLGMDITLKNYEDDPNVLHLPLSEETYNTIKDFFIKETTEMSISHDSHEHPLRRCNDITPPTSEVKDICNACVRPIIAMQSFYKCTNGCNFVLHEWCTRLPTEIKDHKHHPGHTFILLPKLPDFFLNLFRCHICYHFCNGFAYSCCQCEYRICVSCAFIPEKITHKSHPNHLLSRVEKRLEKDYCRMCLSGFTDGNKTSFSCTMCKFHLHPECALLLPETTRHKYDKHPMTLSYFPIENHIGDYFCEVCEEELNPNACFYHCHACVQSMHTSCALLVPQREPYILSGSRVKAAFSDNDQTIKFGSIHETEDHPHPLAFLKLTENEGNCTKCGYRFPDNGLILKCLQCKFTIHHFCAIDFRK